MATINRSDIISKAVSDLGLSPSKDVIPSETSKDIQLNYSLNKEFSSFIASNNSGGSGSTTVTLPTIDVKSRIFITSIDASMIKDATCDITTSAALGVSATTQLEGIAKVILPIPVITLTAQDENRHIDFAYPLELKPNTNITIAFSFSLGVLLRAVSVCGFSFSPN